MRRLLPATLLASLLGATVVPVPATAAGEAFCSLPGLEVREWTGAGDGTTWSDDANWNGNAPTNSTYDRENVLACIDADGVVVMPALQGNDAHVQAIDVAAGTTLRLEEGSKLFVYGDQDTRPSRIRAGASLRLLGASFGGPGRTVLAGTLVWRSLPPPASSTLVSSPCMLTVGADEPPPSCTIQEPGALQVAPTGVVSVDGRGVNLFDRYVLEVDGELRLSNRGYIAADRGTALRIRAGGLLDIRNDGGIYEGFTRAYPGQDPLPLAEVRNDGKIRKRSGDGTSAVVGTYSGSSSNAVVVRTGTLSLADGSGREATVAPGRTFGSGTCRSQAGYGCRPITSSADPLSVRITVPTADVDGAGVIVEEDVLAPGPDDLVAPVKAHARDLDASARRPAVLTLRLDHTVTEGRSWSEIDVYRQARAGEPFRKVRPCDGMGRPPRGQVACVDRNREAGSSTTVHDAEDPAGAKDVVMVVRTRDTSRWVAR